MRIDTHNDNFRRTLDGARAFWYAIDQRRASMHDDSMHGDPEPNPNMNEV